VIPNAIHTGSVTDAHLSQTLNSPALCPEAADSEPASTVPQGESRILRPLVFRTQRLLLFKRSNNARTESTAHYPNAIKNNRMQYYGLQINYPINICVPCLTNKLSNKYLCSLLNACVKKLIVTDGRDTISRLNYLQKNSKAM